MATRDRLRADTVASWLAFRNGRLGVAKLITSPSTCEACDRTPTLRPKHRYRGLLTSFIGRASLLPTVRAEEAVDAPVPPRTTIEKLGQGVPHVLITDQQIKEYIDKETGMDRLHELFSRDNENHLHPDMQQVFQSTVILSVTGFALMSIYGSKIAREKFVKKNQATKFETKFKALRAYNDASIIGGVKTGMLWSIRMATFGALFMTSSATISTYRNKTGILEYLGAGAITGSILRMHLGLRGFFAGGVIGGFLGCAAGSMMCLLLKASNETQEKRHYWVIHEKLMEEKRLASLKPAEIPQEQQVLPS